MKNFFKVSDEIKKTHSQEAHESAVRQSSSHTITTTNSKCVVSLRSKRKCSGTDSQTEDKCSGIRDDGSPKLSEIITTKRMDTKKDKLKENQCSVTKRSESEKIISERAVFSRTRCSEEQNFVRLSVDKMKNVLEIGDKDSELKTIQNDRKFEECIHDPVLQHGSSRKKQVQIDSRSPKDNQELMTDVKQLNDIQNSIEVKVVSTEEEDVNTKSGETAGNQILNDDSAEIWRLSEKEAANVVISWKTLDERKSLKDENNLKKREILNNMESENQITKEKQSNIQSATTQVQRKVTLKNGLENSEIAVKSLSENLRIMRSREAGVTQNSKQLTSRARKRKLSEEGDSNAEDKLEDIAASLQKSKMAEIHCGKEPVVCYNFFN